MKLRYAMLALAALSAGPAFAAGPREEHGIAFTRSRARTITAVVEAIDQTTREVTLRGPKGNRLTFQASERVKNLPQVKVGDLVTVDYYESLEIYVSKPDGAASESYTTSASAKPGEKPAGYSESHNVTVATVKKIAKNKTSVTLKEMDGSTIVVLVKNEDNLEGVEVGDQVTIVTSEELAVSVKKAPAKRKSPAK